MARPLTLHFPSTRPTSASTDYYDDDDSFSILVARAAPRAPSSIG